MRSPSRWSPALISLALLIVVGGCASSGSNDAGAKPPAQKKSRLHRFEFKEQAPANRETGGRLPGEGQVALLGPDGEQVKISDYAGKPVVLVFNRGFAGFICPYCTTYTAQIAARYDDLKAAGAEVLLVYPTADEDQAKIEEFKAAVEELLAEDGSEGMPFPVLLDPGLNCVLRYNIQGDLSKPSTFVLDRDGAIRYVYVGQDVDDRPSVDRILEEVRALAGS